MSQRTFQKDLRVHTHPATDCWMRGERFGTVTLVGRKYVHVKMDASGKVRKFAPDLLIRVNVEEIGKEPRKAPEPPASMVGRKCWYLTPSGRKVAAVIDSLDYERHPTRLNLRITATKDPQYSKGRLVNTPPAFITPR